VFLEDYKRGLAISELFEVLCDEHLSGPIHIIDHPKETTPLCKLHRDDKSLIERNEPYMHRMELGNIYSELNDPNVQEELMNDQKDQGRAKGESHPVDTDFIESLKYGMPPAYGIGFGVDRLVMLFTNSQNIRDVILFPMLREEEGEEKENAEKK
ncbi:MAG: amino acid--tRNA ligase-related protein, partial [archaeon]